MSERNGDRARFQKNRKRKLNQRERTRALLATRTEAAAATVAGEGTNVGGTEAPSGVSASAAEDTRAAGAAE